MENTIKPQYIVPKGFGEIKRDEWHYSQVVKVGNRVELAGQGGWNDKMEFPDNLRDEYVQVFDNIERVLKESGVSWDDVISINSYHVGTWDSETMKEEMLKHMPNHCPIWTVLGVAFLGMPEMHVEIRVTAIINIK